MPPPRHCASKRQNPVWLRSIGAIRSGIPPAIPADFELNRVREPYHLRKLPHTRVIPRRSRPLVRHISFTSRSSEDGSVRAALDTLGYEQNRFTLSRAFQICTGTGFPSLCTSGVCTNARGAYADPAPHNRRRRKSLIRQSIRCLPAATGSERSKFVVGGNCQS